MIKIKRFAGALKIEAYILVSFSVKTLSGNICIVCMSRILHTINGLDTRANPNKTLMGLYTVNYKLYYSWIEPDGASAWSQIEPDRYGGNGASFLHIIWQTPCQPILNPGL